MQESKIGNDNALKYKSAEELQKAINDYFLKCDEKEKPYTMTGLAISLGVDRTTLINYGKRDSFSTLVKNAKARVEEQLEESLYRLGNNSGVIFNLKNNYGWRDKVEYSNDGGEISKLDEILKEIKKDATEWETKRVY